MNRAQEIINAISKGEQKEKYAEWAKNGNAQIRYTLARHGYYPEIFIKDENENIRIETVAAHPEYIQYLLNDENQYETVNNILSKEHDIDIEVLKQHIQDLKTFEKEYFREDMELKLEAMQYEPTPYVFQLLDSNKFTLGQVDGYPVTNLMRLVTFIH